MTAESIAKTLGGRRAGGGWMAHCPAHEDRTPSLSIRDTDDETVLVHCFACCGQERVIAALRARGLWPKRPLSPRTSVPPKLLRPNGAQPAGDHRRTEDALHIWQASVPASGTLVETYLQARGISIPVPSSLRFHARLKHRSGSEWPAMVGLVMRGSDPVAIHRTFLARDGTGKAPVDPQKMMLGPCRGGAVRLAEADAVLMVGEGIETCLSAMQATGYPAWAALSASGLPTLELPSIVSEVIFLADGDPPGEAAARCGARRWVRQGRRVRIARPPRGLDFNDLI